MGPNVVLLAILMYLKNALTLADDHIGEAQAKSWDNRVKRALTAQCNTRKGCLTPLCSERNLEGPSDEEDFGGEGSRKSMPPNTLPGPAESTNDLSKSRALTADFSLTRKSDAKQHRGTGKGCFIRTFNKIFHIDGNMKKTKLSIQGWKRGSHVENFYVEAGNFYVFVGKMVLKIGKYSRFKVNFRSYKYISGLTNTMVHNIALDTKNALFVAETTPFLRFYNLERRKMKTIGKLHGTQMYLDRHNRCIFFKKDTNNIGKADYNGKLDKSFQCSRLATAVLLMESRGKYYLIL